MTAEPVLSSLTKRIVSHQLLVSYRTPAGIALVGNSEQVIDDHLASALRGKVQLVFTSPPFPLNRKKRYGNREGDQYLSWLADFAVRLKGLLTADGSIVIELGNSWEPGSPVMSTLALESLLAFKKAGGFHLCQEFIWYNPAKLPTPAQWVTVDRVRVKDAYTRLWWLSPVARPKADNRRVLFPYSSSMVNLLKTKRYNAGKRPSEHVIGEKSFLKNNGGAIPPNFLAFKEDDTIVPTNVLEGSNTRSSDEYFQYCKSHGLTPHPARMPTSLAEFFVRLCTEPADLVLDPFAGSNTTGFAAESAGRQWVSIEADKSYAQTGISRFGVMAVSESTRKLGMKQPRVKSRKRKRKG